MYKAGCGWMNCNKAVTKVIMQCFHSIWMEIKCSIDTPLNEEEMVLELYCTPNESATEECNTFILVR